MDGITRPTKNIIKNRFELTINSKDVYDIKKVKSVMNDISAVWLSAEGKAKASSKVNTAVNPVTEYWEEITEEIVEYEDWMASDDPDSVASKIGITYKLDKTDWNGDIGLALEHPEILEAPKQGSLYITKTA
jgi:hypothetical protein